ncbi:MAG: hypothetical protein KJ630_01940 [Proteobacteria bacterium]|nr:hypothetical protein [Pseudomonadota bacterium]
MDSRQISIRRVAIISDTSIIATCPLDCQCLQWVNISERNKKVICGYYQGSMTGRDGAQITCGFINVGK